LRDRVSLPKSAASTQASLPENSIKNPANKRTKLQNIIPQNPFRKNLPRASRDHSLALARDEKEAFTKPSPRASALLCKP